MRQSQWAQCGASAWIAHSKLSKVCAWPPLTLTEMVLSYSFPQTSQRSIRISFHSSRDRIGAADLVLQLHDAVEQRLRGRRAAGHVDIHGHDAVAAAHHRVRVVV